RSAVHPALCSVVQSADRLYRRCVHSSTSRGGGVAPGRGDYDERRTYGRSPTGRGADVQADVQRHAEVHREEGSWRVVSIRVVVSASSPWRTAASPWTVSEGPPIASSRR